MYCLYSLALAGLLLLTSPYWLFRVIFQGKYREGLWQRLGAVRADVSAPASIWVHAVSVGEVLAVSGLVEGLRQCFPELPLFISTTTKAGNELARQRFGAERVFYFPLDFAFAVRPYLRIINPRLVIMAETEFWPNFLRLAKEHGAKIAVVNARISDRSLPGYRRWRKLLAGVLANVDLFLTQTQQDSVRLAEVGAGEDRIYVAGNLKYDIAAPEPPGIVEDLRRQLMADDAGPVLVFGSTVEDEEALVLQGFTNVLSSYPRATLLLAPRHPERFREVERILAKLALPYQLRSRWKGESLDGKVLLIDSIGELSALYALADIAFVGGSLVPRGGHNLIEPARHGVAIVVGNHTENFREIVQTFESRNAVRIAGPAEFPLVLLDMLRNDEERSAMGQRALETMHTQMGATERTLDQLTRLFANDARTPAAGPLA